MQKSDNPKIWWVENFRNDSLVSLPRTNALYDPLTIEEFLQTHIADSGFEEMTMYVNDMGGFPANDDEDWWAQCLAQYGKD